MGKLKDRVGERFGRLVVIEKDTPHITPKGKYVTKWLCNCDCGNAVSVLVDNLKNGSSTSCGCYAKECSSTHNMSKSSTYLSWESMKRRCSNPAHQNYEHYSKLGFDPSWTYFENFFLDMGVRPEGTSLDRIDNTKGYCKENCRWATKSVQQHNRDLEHSTEFKGVHYYKATGKYQAYITKDGVKHHLGYYDSAEVAAKVRDDHSKLLYEQHASLNIPT